MKSNTLSEFKMKQAAIENFFDEIKGLSNEENVGIGGVNTAISNFLKALEEVKEKKIPKISLWHRFMNFIRSLFRSNRKRGQNDAVIEKVESKELKGAELVESKGVESALISTASIAVVTPMTISSEQSNTLVLPPPPSPLFAAASSSSLSMDMVTKAKCEAKTTDIATELKEVLAATNEKVGAVKDTEKNKKNQKKK